MREIQKAEKKKNSSKSQNTTLKIPCENPQKKTSKKNSKEKS